MAHVDCVMHTICLVSPTKSPHQLLMKLLLAWSEGKRSLARLWTNVQMEERCWLTGRKPRLSIVPRTRPLRVQALPERQCVSNRQACKPTDTTSHVGVSLFEGAVFRVGNVTATKGKPANLGGPPIF